MTPDELRTAIRAAGLRATHQRVAVLAILVAADEPMSRADITERLASAHERSTLYRNLASLVAAKLVRRIELGDRVWRFEYARNTSPRFVCTRCGAIARITALRIDAARAKAPRSVRRGEVEVQLRGLCDTCAGAERP